MSWIKNIIVVLLLMSLSGSFSLYADDTETDYDSTKVEVLKVRAVDPSLPIVSGQESKGQIGYIISKLFDNNGRIGNWYIKALKDVQDNAILRWSGGKNGGFVAGSIYDDGTNVGVGTSTPISLFEINSGQSWSNEIGINWIAQINTNAVGQNTQGKGIGLRIGADNDPEKGVGIAAESNSNNYANTNDMVFYTNSSSSIFDEKMRIESGGNVGIGTTNPNYKLDVSGDVNFTGDLYQGGTVVDFAGKFQDGATAGEIYYNGGNIGIGLTNPSYMLDINGTINATAFRGDGSALIGVNSDTLDGVDSSGFLRSDQDDTFDNGILNINSNSAEGRYWGMGLEYNSSAWRHTNDNSYGVYFRNSGASGFRIGVAGEAGIDGSVATENKFDFQIDGDLKIDGSFLGDGSLLTSISGDNISDGTVDSSEIGDNTIASIDILNNTITEDDIIDSFIANDSDLLDGMDSSDFGRKVLTTSEGTSTDSGYWTQLAEINIVGNYNDGSIILAITSEEGTPEAAIINVTYRQGLVHSLESSSGIEILAKGNGTAISDDSFKIISAGHSQPIELWMRKDDAYQTFSFSELSEHNQNSTITYLSDQGWIATEPTATYEAQSNGLTYAGNTIFHEGNDGIGSGLNADLFDGIDSSNFVRDTGNEAIGGVKTFTSPIIVNNTFDINGTAPSSQQTGLYVADLGATVGTTNNPGYTAAIIGQYSINRSIALSVDDSGYLWGYRTHSSTPTAVFQSKTKFADNTDTLDTLDSTDFIRSNANDSVTGHTEWQDNSEIRIGAGADLRLFHNGTNSYIRNYTGNTEFRSLAHGNEIYFQGEDTAGVNRNLIRMDPDNEVRLYYNGNEKLNTRTDGIEVTGTVIAGEPTAASHLTTKNYVDTLVTAGVTWKAPVATSASATYGTCDASKEGWTTYNKSDDIVYLCDGSAWISIGASASIPYATTTTSGRMQIAGDIQGTWNNITIKDSVIDSDNILNNTITEDDIIDSFVARDSNLLDGIDSSSFLRSDQDDILDAQYIHDSNTNAQKFFFTRTGNVTNEYLSIGTDDLYTYFDRSNDEASAGIRFDLAATDTETGGGVNANSSQINFITDTLGGRITIDGNSVLTSADSIPGDSIIDGTIDSSEIEDNTITADDLATNSVGNNEMVDNATFGQLIVTDGQGFAWENGVNRITHNDGAGNVQLRFGHDFSSSVERFTHAGSAFYIGGDLDDSVAGTANLDFKVSSNGGAGNDAAVTWGKVFRIGDSELTWDGNNILTDADSIPGDSITDGTIDSSEIEDNTIASTDILNNTITEDDISDAFVARDSNLLDGVNSSNFLRSDIDDTAYGNISFSTQDRGISFGNVPSASTPTIRTGFSQITGGSDYAGLSKLNNVAVQTWYGFSISPTISGQTVAQGTPAFSVNARTGDAYIAQDLSIGGTLSGDSITDGTIDASELEANSVTSSELAGTLSYTDSAADSVYRAITIDHNVSGATVLTADRTHSSLRLDVDSSATGGDTSNEHRVYGVEVDVDVTGDSDLVYGAVFDARANHTAGTISELRGTYNYVRSDSSAQVSNVRGTYNYAVASANGTVNNVTGSVSKTLKDAGSTNTITTFIGQEGEVEIDAGTITNAYATRSIIDQDGGTITNGYLFFGDYQGTLPTNAYGVYIADDVDNYFAGNVGIGTNNPGHKLTVEGNINANGSFYYGDSKEIIDYADSWLRLNQNSDFTGGTYTPGLFRADGGLRVGDDEGFYRGGEDIIDTDDQLHVNHKIIAIGNIESGGNSGGVAMTINDGYGNANLTFNHTNGIPEQNGNAARIEVNTDNIIGASMSFELKSGVTNGTAVALNQIMILNESGVQMSGSATQIDNVTCIGNCF